VRLIHAGGRPAGNDESPAVIREETGRKVIHCDRCPVRLDLGPSNMAAMRLRMPSGWIQDEPDHHLCPACSRRAFDELVAARKAAERKGGQPEQ
jgi:hypothetical protein